MKRLLKHKLYRYIFAAAGSLFIAFGIVSVSQNTALAANSAGYCFYQPTGIVYNCTDVQGVAPDGGFAAGSCYTSTGALDSNGDPHWQTDDCSNSAFANGPTCPPTGAQTGYSCKISPDSNATDNPCQSGDNGCQALVSKYINPFINFLAAGVGIIVTIMIIIGAIQYSTSQDNPQAVSAAKKRIFNAVLALIIFGLMYALLQWLVPGGAFN
jgi:hypothetical protein